MSLGVAPCTPAGYFSCFRLSALWVGISLNGGGGHIAMWYSRDGLDWMIDPRQIVDDVDLSGSNDLRVASTSIRPFRWHGDLYASFYVGDMIGGAEGTDTTAYTARLAPSLRMLASPRRATGLTSISSLVRHTGSCGPSTATPPPPPSTQLSSSDMGLIPGDLIRDALGEFLPFGQTRIQKVANSLEWLGGTLPNWLYVQDGTGAASGPDTTYGYYEVTSAATVGAIAKLSVNQTISSTQVRAILFEVDSFRLVSASAPVTSGLAIVGPGSSGGSAMQTYPSDKTILSSAGTPSTTLNYDMHTSGEGVARRNLGLLLMPRVKKVALLEAGRVVGVRSDPSMVNNSLRPSVSLTTRTAAAQAFRVSQVRLTVWHD